VNASPCFFPISGKTEAMKPPDLRIKTDSRIWAKVPRKADDAFDYFYRKLIEENEKIMALAEKKGCGPFDEPVRKKLRPAQKVLALVRVIEM